MALNGLEKITDKIIAEANAEAEKILADASAECARISADYEQRAAALKEKLLAIAEKENSDLVLRAKSNASMQERNILLGTESELIDGVFASAEKAILSQDPAAYTELLVGLLTAAFSEQLEAEKTGVELYGAEDAVIPTAYEVIFNQKDHDKYGAAVVEGARKKLAGKAPAEKLSMLKLSDTTVSTVGGVILRYGDIESNCSLDLLFAQLRSELEGEVGHLLFDARKQA